MLLTSTAAVGAVLVLLALGEVIQDLLELGLVVGAAIPHATHLGAAANESPRRLRWSSWAATRKNP